MHWKCGVLTTGLLGKSPLPDFFFLKNTYEARDSVFQTGNTKKKEDAEYFLHLRHISVFPPWPSLSCFLAWFEGSYILDATPSCCTYGHVRFASCINSFSDRVNKVAADPKIAHLHLAQGVDEHIGRLDI